MFSDDDSMPHLKGRTEGHTKDTWKTCLQKIKLLVCFTLPHRFQKLFRGKHSHEVQSVRVQILPSDAINSFQSKKH